MLIFIHSVILLRYKSFSYWMKIICTPNSMIYFAIFKWNDTLFVNSKTNNFKFNSNTYYFRSNKWNFTSYSISFLSISLNSFSSAVSLPKVIKLLSPWNVTTAISSGFLCHSLEFLILSLVIYYKWSIEKAYKKYYSRYRIKMKLSMNRC